MSPRASTSTKPVGHRRRLWALIGVVAIGAIVFVLLYFEPQAAFIDDTVDEALPGLDAALAPTSTAAAQAPTMATPTSLVPESSVPESSVPDSSVPESSVPESSVPESSVPETTILGPANSLSASSRQAQESGLPVIVSTGTFFSGEHDTDGTALVVALPDGSLVVRFEDLDTSNGPDLRVVLSPEPASDSWQYDDRLHLGELKGNVGDQNYLVAADVDLSRYRSVVIWCERFSVAFGAAPIDVVI
jgi:hypothetical protein